MNINGNRVVIAKNGDVIPCVTPVDPVSGAQVYTGSDGQSTSGLVLTDANGNPFTVTGQTGGQKNLLINSGFRINQRSYVSGAALANGQYAHDRWKAVFAANYTFDNASPDTTIRMGAGMSVQQVIDPTVVEGGDYVFSWEGGAFCQVTFTNADGSAGKAGYGLSPLYMKNVKPNTSMIVFVGDSGACLRPQVEKGRAPTVYERRHLSTEQKLCDYYFQSFGGDYPYEYFATAFFIKDTAIQFWVPTRGKMRVMPNVLVSAPGDFGIHCPVDAFYKLTALSCDHSSTNGAGFNATPASSGTAGWGGVIQAANSMNARLNFDSEL